MLTFDILLSALANGLMTGAVYALIALGLTLVYGVWRIVSMFDYLSGIPSCNDNWLYF